MPTRLSRIGIYRGMSLKDKPDFLVPIVEAAQSHPTESEALADTLTDQEREFLEQITRNPEQA